MSQQSQGLTDWDNCVRRKVMSFENPNPREVYLLVPVYCYYAEGMFYRSIPSDASSPSMYDLIALMLTCRHGRKKYIGSRCSPGLIAVHHRPCSRHGRHDSTRTSGGGPTDRRRACQEETAKGRFHLQVRAPFHTHTQSHCASQGRSGLLGALPALVRGGMYRR